MITAILASSPKREKAVTEKSHVLNETDFINLADEVRALERKVRKGDCGQCPANSALECSNAQRALREAAAHFEDAAKRVRELQNTLMGLKDAP